MPYCAPEIINADCKIFNSNNDIFSFGVLMSEFLFD